MVRNDGHTPWPVGGEPLLRRVLLVVLLQVVILAMALPAGATKPSGVDIVVETSLLSGTGPFVASGPAVDDGLVCAEGETNDVFAKTSGSSKNGFNVQVIKQFICDDNSGEFFVKLQARIDYRKGTTFNWTVVGDGTGNYEDLRGSGNPDGLPDCGPDCVLDIYEGGLHNH